MKTNLEAGKSFKARTDLAVEANEDVSKEDGRRKGVIVREECDIDPKIKTTWLEILDKRGEEALGKSIGTYITIESEELPYAPEDFEDKLVKKLTEVLKRVMEPFMTVDHPAILVLGLGNREVTPDCLGPFVVDKVTAYETIRAVAPGVRAQTGMETADIVRGIVQETKPDIVLAVDALAARSSRRLNRTIQLSNQGIHPGSGVGNHRTGITQETVGVPVVALGIPTVIDTPTIIIDALERFIDDRSDEEKYKLICETLEPWMTQLFVTPRDVDASVRRLSSIVADAINEMTENE